MMKHFQFFGFRQQREPDQKPFQQWTLPDGTHWVDFYRIDAEYLLRFHGYGDFHVSNDGQAVQCWGVPGVAAHMIQHLLLNQVMPLALSRQGKLVLHGSAVEVGSHALAFLGLSGRGKSTLAASFARSGYRFLADDGLVLEPAAGGWQIIPSHPSIRLWEDSGIALRLDPESKAPPLDFTSKSRFLAGDGLVLCDGARPLRRVYFLGEGNVGMPVFEQLKPEEALIQLVSNSFLLDVVERKTLITHFDELCSLVRLPLWYRLDYPRRFEDLSDLRQAIVDHAQLSDKLTHAA